MRRIGWPLALAVLLSAGLFACGGDPRGPAAPTPILPLVLNLEGAFRLSGTVRDYSGHALSVVKVWVNSDVPRTITDATGRYTFRGAAQGLGSASEVRAESDGFYEDVRRISVGSDTVQDLELTPPLADITAGASVTAEVHAGPHSRVCSDTLTGRALPSSKAVADWVCASITRAPSRPAWNGRARRGWR